MRFLVDFSVPFTNNLAEQALRMMKVKMKISGAFRIFEAARDFAAVRSVVATARKRGWNILHTLTARPQVPHSDPGRVTPSLGVTKKRHPPVSQGADCRSVRWKPIDRTSVKRARPFLYCTNLFDNPQELFAKMSAARGRFGSKARDPSRGRRRFIESWQPRHDPAVQRLSQQGETGD